LDYFDYLKYIEDINPRKYADKKSNDEINSLLDKITTASLFEELLLNTESNQVRARSIREIKNQDILLKFILSEPKPHQYYSDYYSIFTTFQSSDLLNYVFKYLDKVELLEILAKEHSSDDVRKDTMRHIEDVLNKNLIKQIETGQIKDQIALKDIYLNACEGDKKLRHHAIENINDQSILKEIYEKIASMSEYCKTTRNFVNDLLGDAGNIKPIIYKIKDDNLLEKIARDAAPKSYFGVMKKDYENLMRWSVARIKSQNILLKIIQEDDQITNSDLKETAFYSIKDKEVLKKLWKPDDKVFGSIHVAALLEYNSYILEKALNGSTEAVGCIKSEEDLAKVAIEGKGIGYMKAGSEKFYSDDDEDFNSKYVEGVQDKALKRIYDPALLEKVVNESKDRRIQEIAAKRLNIYKK